MTLAEPFGWMNTVLPVVVLAAMAAIVPLFTVPRETRSHKDVAWGIVAAAGTLQILAMVLFAAIYWLEGIDVLTATGGSILATVVFFFKQSDFAALVWVPILGFMWFQLTLGVEKRRGEDLAERGSDTE